MLTPSRCVLLGTTPIVRWFGLMVFVSVSPTQAEAAKPELAFDFARIAECRVVTEESDDELYDDEKLIELNLQVSVHLLRGKPRDVEELRIEINDCDSRIRIDSFSPNTRLESNLTEDITVTKTTESGNSWGASLGGEAPVPVGNVVAHVLPSVNGGQTNREVLVEKQVRKAPKYAIVASGTTQQEHGVFFKLRASPQTTLEGSHEITIRFIVPQNWRGDSLHVCCQATGQEKFLWTKQQTTWSRKCSPLAIYLAGDLEARAAAEQHVSQQAL